MSGDRESTTPCSICGKPLEPTEVPSMVNGEPRYRTWLVCINPDCASEGAADASEGEYPALPVCGLAMPRTNPPGMFTCALSAGHAEEWHDTGKGIFGDPEAHCSWRDDSEARNWVVWSFEHDSWWASQRSGYVQSLLLAGLYTEVEAKEIERRANHPKRKNERALSLAQALIDERARWGRKGLIVLDLLDRGVRS